MGKAGSRKDPYCEVAAGSKVRCSCAAVSSNLQWGVATVFRNMERIVLIACSNVRWNMVAVVNKTYLTPLLDCAINNV